MLVKALVCHSRGFCVLNNFHPGPFVQRAHLCLLLTSPSPAELHRERRNQASSTRGGPGMMGSAVQAGSLLPDDSAEQALGRVGSHRVEAHSAWYHCLFCDTWGTPEVFSPWARSKVFAHLTRVFDHLLSWKYQNESTRIPAGRGCGGWVLQAGGVGLEIVTVVSR